MNNRQMIKSTIDIMQVPQGKQILLFFFIYSFGLLITSVKPDLLYSYKKETKRDCPLDQGYKIYLGSPLFGEAIHDSIGFMPYVLGRHLKRFSGLKNIQTLV
ncbi:hypothetical protein AMTRI_Chr04g242410 [Amborella trichopoda]